MRNKFTFCLVLFSLLFAIKVSACYFSIDNTSQCLTGNIFTFTNTTGNNGQTWKWDFGDGSANVTTYSTTHTYTTPGSYTVTLNEYTGGNHYSVTHTLTVKETPTGVTATSDGPICQGGTLHLTGTTTSTSVTYAWTGPNSFTSTAQNPSITGVTTAAAGNYTFTVTKSGCTKTATVAVVIGTPPTGVTANNNGPVCVGGTINLIGATTTSGATYLWTGPNGYSSTSLSPSISGATTLMAGTYTLAVKKNTCTTTATTTVTVNSAPTGVSAANNGPICAGSTLTLSGSSLTAGVTYSWTGPNSFTASTQNPSIASATIAAAGTYTLTVSKSGCSATATTTPVVNAAPAGVTANGSTVCAGGTLTLTSSSTTSGVTYAWSGPNSFTSTSQNPSISNATTAATGTYTVTVSKNSCSTTATATGTVNALPAGVTAANGGNVCAGNTLSLTGSSTTPGATYAWSGPNSFTSSTQNPSIANATTAATGTYTLTVTGTNSCTANATTSATVYPNLTDGGQIGNDESVCGGFDPALITNTTAPSGASGIIEYVWLITTDANTAAGNASNYSVIPGANSNTYDPPSISVTTWYRRCARIQGCGNYPAESNWVKKEVKAVPAGVTANNNGPVCAGATLNLTGSSTTSGVTYSWNGPNSFSSSTQNPSISNVTVAAAGTYTLTVSKSGCSAQATTVAVVNAVPAAVTASNDGPVCAGNTLTLSAGSTTPGVTYSWSGPNSFSSSTQNPTIASATVAASGTYTVTVTGTNTCTATATTSPVVYPNLTNGGTIGTDQALCGGYDPALITNTAAPSGASGTVEYMWQMTTDAATAAGSASLYSTIASANNNTYDPPAITVTTWYRRLARISGCGAYPAVSNWVKKEVKTLPAAVAASSNTPVCENSALNLTGSSTTSGVSYSWTGPNNFTSSAQNPTIATATPATAGLYTLTVTGSNSCTATATTTVVVTTLATNVTASSNSPVCAGSTVTLSGSTTSTGVSYSWAGPNSFTSTIQNPTIPNATVAASGTYTLTVRRSGCNATATTSVTVNPGPTAGFTVNNPSQAITGNNFIFTNTGTATGVTYAWKFGDGGTATGANTSHSYVSIGTYTVTQTLTNTTTGCMDSIKVIVTVNPDGTVAQFSANSSVQCLSSNSFVFTNQSSGTAPITYVWNFGDGSPTSTATNPTHTYTGTGIYAVKLVTTGAGGADSVTHNVTVNSNPAGVTASSNSPVCRGGTVNLSANSTTSGVSYSWTGPNGFASSIQNPSISNVNSANGGTYTVTVTGSNTCATTATTSVTINALPTGVTAGSNSPVCEGSTVSLTANSTASGVSYSWSGPNSFSSNQQNPTISNVTTAANGTYTVTVTGTNTCSATATTSLVINAKPTGLTAGSNSPQCEGGTLNFTSSSTTSGVSYAWTGPNSFTSAMQNPSIANVTLADAGTYTVTVTGTNTCSANATTTVVLNPLPTTVSASSNAPICEGTTLNLSGSSATPGVTYSWTGPNGFITSVQNPSIANVTSAAGGTYTVSASKGGCSTPANTIVVIKPLPAGVTAGNNGPICASNTLTLSSSSTTSGVSYSWSGPLSFTSAVQNPTINNAPTTASGTYTVTVTGTNSCYTTATTTPTVYPNLTNGGQIGADEAVCGGYDPALINNVTLPSGASGTIEYNWYMTTDVNTAAGSATNYTLIPGALSSTYDPSAITVTTWYRRVARIQGCGAYPAQSNWVKKEVNNAPANITATSNSPVCEGGMVSLMGNSSNSGVTYSWSGPNSFTSTAQNPTISNATSAASGLYTLTVTGASNCTGTATTTVVVNALPTAVAASSNTPICEGSNLNLTGSSTTSGVTYAWSGPNNFTSSAQNPSISSASLAAAGTYTLTVSKNGCSTPATTSVVVNAVPTNVSSSNTPVCANDTLTLLGSSTTSGASYSWTGPNSFTSTDQNPLIYNVTTAAAGTYTLTVSKNGCSSASTTTVVVNTLPNNVTASSNTPVCTGYTLNLFGNSTTPSVTYAWSGPNGFASIQQNPSIPDATSAMAGTYTLTVSSVACGTTATTNVVVNPGPSAGFTVNDNSQNLTGNNFVFTTTNFVVGNTYSWNFGDAATSTSVNPSHTYGAIGTYTVVQYVHSSNGCLDTISQYVTVNPDTVHADFTINDTDQCLSGNSFVFNSTVTGTGPFTYVWDFGDATTSTSPNPTHVYTAANPGGYTVTLVVTGAAGSYAVSHDINVSEGPSTLGFTVNNNTQHLSGNSFVFTSNDTSATSTYAWTFGDAGTSTAKNPTHTYTAVGPYTVMQIVTNSSGCSSSYSLPVFVISDSVGGGGGGGLESESLGGLVSRRDFNRIKFSIDTKTDYLKLPVFVTNVLAKTTGGQELIDMMPAELVPGNVLRTSTPNDLLSLTAAKDVLSIDYTVNQQAKAVVLGIKTFDKAYNHTKSICDRFRGADLLAVDTVAIKGHDFVRFTLRQDDGTVEYAVAFVAGKKAGRSTYSLQTNWLISQYALDDTLYNFQVWAAQPDHTAKLVGDILDKLSASRPLDQINQVVLPKAYVISGIRNKENLVVKINNTGAAGNAKMVFAEHLNEQSGVTPLEIPMTLTTGLNEVNIPIKDGYDFQGQMYLDTLLTDEVYLADGNWGLDYEDHRTALATYKTENHSDRLYLDNEFPLYRSVGLTAATDDYLSLYKAVRPGTEKTNLTAYHSLKFNASGTGTVEIKLTRDSIVDWKSQYKTTVTLDEAGKDYAISFDDFYSEKIKKDFNPKDIKTIVFTFSATSGRKEVINFNVDNVAFSKTVVQSKRGLQSKAITITPNPTSGVFQCHFSSDEERTLDLVITDVTGKVLYTQTVDAVVGNNVVPVDLKTRASVVMISITGKDVKYDVQKLLIQ